MTTRRQYIEIEIRRCRVNLKNTNDPVRKSIIKRHIAYLRKWKDVDLNNANSVNVPVDLVQSVYNIYDNNMWISRLHTFHIWYN